MITMKDFRPIPKYILKKIQKIEFKKELNVVEALQELPHIYWANGVLKLILLV